MPKRLKNRRTKNVVIRGLATDKYEELLKNFQEKAYWLAKAYQINRKDVKLIVEFRGDPHIVPSYRLTYWTGKKWEPIIDTTDPEDLLEEMDYLTERRKEAVPI